MLLEEQVRQWVRDEWAKLRCAEQEACQHVESGTLHNDGTVTCNQCGKELKYEVRA